MKVVVNKLRLTISAELPLKPKISSRLQERISLRALQHLTSFKDQGLITDFWLCSDLQSLFDAARRTGARRVVIGIGYPDLSGLKVEKPLWIETFSGLLAKVEIPPRSKFSDHRLGLALTAAIAHRIGVDWRDVDETSVEAAIWASQRADEPVAFSLRRLAVDDELARNEVIAESNGVALIAKKARHGAEFNVQVHYPIGSDGGRHESALANILRDMLLSVAELTQPEIQILATLFRKELASAGASALRRANLPLFRLSLPIEGTPNEGPDYIGADLTTRGVIVPIATDDDGMSCYVTAKPRLQNASTVRKGVKHSEPEISLDEFKSAIMSQGILLTKSERLEQVYRTVTAPDIGQTLKVLVAQGVQPVHPEDPFIKRAVVNQKGGSFPRLFAAPGDLVAEIVYNRPGSDGMDVFGNIVKQSRADLSQFKPGSGISLKDHSFFATESGAVKIEGNTVLLTEAVSVEGSLSAKEGVFRTKSALAIGGNIEKGASVVCTGALQVAQSFFGDFVKAGADVTIAGGINGSERSEVIVKGNLRVKYVQSGLIRCRGNVTIEANMTGGTVVADGDVTVVDPTGGIFGGTVIAGGKITVGNMGRQGIGSLDVRIGSPVKGIRRKMVLEKREATIVAERERLARYGTKKAAINEKIARLDSLAAQIRERIENISVRANSESQVAVAGTLQSGVRFQIGSDCLVVADAVLGCVVSSRDGRVVIKANNSNEKTATDS